MYDIITETPKYAAPEEALLILVEEEGRQKCLMVDDIIDKQEIVVKSLGERFKNTEGVSAGTILGNGNLGLILDIKGIFQLYENPNKYKNSKFLAKELNIVNS